jgi:hypothetical protein
MLKRKKLASAFNEEEDYVSNRGLVMTVRDIEQIILVEYFVTVHF